MEPFHKAELIRDSAQEANVVSRLMKEYGCSRDDAIAAIEEIISDGVLVKNDKYQVHVTDEGPWVHLSIKRLDKEPIHDWRDMQEIKNMLVGPEHEGLELYPAESRVVDAANQYHLYVLKDNRQRIAAGYGDGLRSEGAWPGTKQRPFDKE
jgi:hypothetical protein